MILPGHLAHTLKPRRARRWSYWRQFAIALMIGIFAVSVAEPGKGGWFVELTNGVMSWVRSYISVPAIPVDPQSIVEFIQAKRQAMSLYVFFGALAVIAYVSSVLMEAVIALFTAWSRRGKSESEIIADGAFRRNFDKGFDWFKNVPFDAMVRLSFSFRYVTIAIASGLFAIVT